ncbi:hypothetical protein BDV12DRAFT_122129 [Aspergillus spectabilis]
MASATKNKTEGLMGLSQSEARLILLGVLLSDSSGKVDFQKLAREAPYKNAASASTSYRLAKKRFHDFNSSILENSATCQTSSPDSTESPNKSLTTPKKTPTKRKRAPAGIDTDAANTNGTTTAEGDCSASPTPQPKKQRKLPTKKAVAVKMEVEADQLTRIRNTVTNPIKSEPKLPAPNNTVATENEEIPKRKSLKSEEEEIMTDLDIDDEFSDMERNQKPIKVEGGGDA